MELYNDIIMIRHGENINDSTTPNNLLPLSKKGIIQAYEAAHILKEKFDIVLCSTSLRTIMTANIISQSIKPISDARLLERGWGNSNQDGKETDEEAKDRFGSFLAEVINKYKDKRILLVTHGALMRLAQDVIEKQCQIRDRIDNCTIIEYTKNKEKIIIKNKII